MKLNKFLDKLNSYHENITATIVYDTITVQYNDMIITNIDVAEYYDKAFLNKVLNVCDLVINADEAQTVEDNGDDNAYCIECHNLMLIDQVINNTLKQESNITPQQIDTLLKLAQLKKMLTGEA